MKILVFDDSKAHRISAKVTLAGHDLTVVGTYDEAQKALAPEMDYEKSRQLLPGLLVEAGLSATFSPYREDKDASDADKAKYFAAREKSQEMATNHPDFDVVLTDLLVPASRQAQGAGMHLVGTEMSLGTTIALLALIVGVKNVAVVTDMDHHSHPASAAFDCFGSAGKCKLPGVSIIATNHVEMVNIDEASEELVEEKFLRDEQHKNTAKGLEKYPYISEYGPRKGLLSGKNWGVILKRLIG